MTSRGLKRQEDISNKKTVISSIACEDNNDIVSWNKNNVIIIVELEKRLYIN